MTTLQSDDNFMNDNFLLQNEIAKKLYHEYAAKTPIIDYHNHLSAEKIAKNTPFDDITEAWLSEDHYKWRAMRANGIEEKYVTGPTSGIEKFRKWAATVPYTVKNPLFHWTHLELRRYFGIKEILQPSTADAIYKKASEKLQNTTAQELLAQMNVEVVCTTDDIVDDLKWHKHIADNNFKIKVLPTFRSDNVLHIENDAFLEYLKILETTANLEIKCFNDLLEILKSRVQYFHENGCRLSDYGLPGALANQSFTNDEVDIILKKRLSEEELTAHEYHKYRCCVMYHLAIMYHEKGWVQQYHLGAIRNNNSRLQKEFGADAGCDSVGDTQFAESLSAFLNRLDTNSLLAKTIIYNLNPSQNEVFAAMAGNFNTSEIPGKIQWGAAWWFQDQKNGITNHINTLSDFGLLSRFVGMLTDSRSFLSFPRHEYFRRVLCNNIGVDVENGELPNDLNFLGKMIQNICYYNAVNYFQFHNVHS